MAKSLLVATLDQSAHDDDDRSSLRGSGQTENAYTPNQNWSSVFAVKEQCNNPGYEQCIQMGLAWRGEAWYTRSVNWKEKSLVARPGEVPDEPEGWPGRSPIKDGGDALASMSTTWRPAGINPVQGKACMKVTQTGSMSGASLHDWIRAKDVQGFTPPRW